MKTKNKNALYWIWLADICGAASRRAVRLVREFGSPEKIFKLNPADIVSSGILNENDRIYSNILRHDLQTAREIITWCDKASVSVITPESDEYPANFLSLYDAPLVLYVVGTLPDFNSHCSVSVVGTRSMTEYGATQAFRFGYALGKSGAITVSGLALGVDGLAMASAIEGGGVTVGIIGGALDKLYPKDHRLLMNKCLEKGAVISEYAPGTSPSKYTFPQRNRLISALSQATVVIEGSGTSGALITARHALYQGKDLFAVPGSIDKDSAVGPNSLIREGAFAAISAKDVLERYEFIYSSTVSCETALRCLDGVDCARSAELTSEKYRTHGTLRDKNGVYYKNFENGSCEFEGSSVALSSEPFERPDTFENAPKYKSEAVKAKKEKKERKPKAGGKSDSKDTFFKTDKPKKARIDFSVLGDTEFTVYASMKADTPMLPDEIVVKGLGVKDIMSSLTLLEISGAVESGAAGYYMRTASDEMPGGNTQKTDK